VAMSHQTMTGSSVHNDAQGVRGANWNNLETVHPAF
jgi:hypothetical protein